jgi:signal transduction histidine kinase
MMRFLPQSLIGRTLAVLLVGLAASHLATFAIFAWNRSEALKAMGGHQMAERVAAAALGIEENLPADRPYLARSLSAPGLRLFWAGDVPPGLGEPHGAARLVADEIRAHLGRHAAVLTAIGPRQSWGRGDMHRMMRGIDPAAEKWLSLAVGLKDGSWLIAQSPFDFEGRTGHPSFLFPFLSVSLIALALTLWAALKASRPLARFARAAQRLGTDIEAPPLDETGPSEVRNAAKAFNEMQERLKRFVGDRTRMLAAISHDLRTPITRMRLRAEFIEDEEIRAKMEADLAEMESMIQAALGFARNEAADEPRGPLNLAELLKQVAQGATEAGGEASFEGPPSTPFTGAPSALKRAFANLADNGVKYGERVRITLSDLGHRIDITFDDDGPGIPEEERENVFRPFHRLEGSRSRETGGVGLGLAVARGILRAHGGDIVLENRAQGGLRAVAFLPRPES